VRQIKKRLEPFLLRAPKEFYIFPAIRTTNGSTNDNHDHVQQQVPLVIGSRIFQAGEMFTQHAAVGT
jgi:hypothetical protein